MLALVPYIANRPGVAISEIAAEFGVSAKQITADLNLLMVCGEPGYFPGELIDVVFDDVDGSVSIAYDAGIGSPVRLTGAEAVALTAALRALRELPGLPDSLAVDGALAKLDDAVEPAGPPVAVLAAESSPQLAEIGQALTQRRRIRIRYYTASRDASTDREVDPIRILVFAGRSYLLGFCHFAQAQRTFRIDRIDSVELLGPAEEVAATPVDGAVAEMFQPRFTGPRVTLELDAAAMWVAEYYSAESTGPRPDGAAGIRITMPVPNEEWAIRLVLSLGGHARFVDRPDLANAVRERAAAALAAY